VIPIKEIHAEFYQGGLNGRDHFGNLSVGRVISKSSSSASATVHDELWPFSRLFTIGPNPVTFVSIWVFLPG
jgi:hypothetical protein